LHQKRVNPANAGQRIGSCGILLEMWRISTLLWPAVEWWERQAERRRFRYCVEHKLRSAESLPLQRVSLFARLRSIAALFLLMFVGRA
jgi:hypothetical protein